MGTIAEFAVVHPDVATAERAIDAAMAELRLVESTMTRFDPRSEIGRANASAGREPVAIGAATALVVAEALRWADATNGAFDPAIGGAIELWDVEHRHEPPPTARARLSPIASCSGKSSSMISEVNHTCAFMTRPCTWISAQSRRAMVSTAQCRRFALTA
jgi:thiamine biosynthesis lipoprotein